MRLDELQRQLAAAIRGEANGGPGDYVASVEESPGLIATREIIAAWRDLLLRRGCPLTVALLEQRGRLTAAFAELAHRHLSAYIEVASCEFLRRFERDADPLVAAVACFERAVIEARQGKEGAVIIEWPHPPDEVIERLLSGLPVEGILSTGTYAMTVCRE